MIFVKMLSFVSKVAVAIVSQDHGVGRGNE